VINHHDRDKRQGETEMVTFTVENAINIAAHAAVAAATDKSVNGETPAKLFETSARREPGHSAATFANSLSDANHCRWPVKKFTDRKSNFRLGTTFKISSNRSSMGYTNSTEACLCSAQVRTSVSSKFANRE